MNIPVEKIFPPVVVPSPIAVSFPSALGISVANFPIITYLVISNFQKK